MKLFVIILIALLFCPASGYGTMADETKYSHIIQNDVISIGGTYRLRGEIDDEFNVKKYGTGTQDDFLLSRLRLEIDLKVAKNMRIHAQIQDAEVLGSSLSDKDFSGSNNPFHDPFDINQLYLEYWPVEKFGSPGNYGGTWCSPAPLYRQLAPKKNTSARMIDMTSFDFVTATLVGVHWSMTVKGTDMMNI